MFFLTSNVRAGVEEHVLSLIKGLDGDRFSIGLVCPARLLGALGPELAAVPVECHAVETISGGRLWNARRLLDVIKGFRPDIVHTHLFRATLTGAPVARAAGVAAVVETYHGREAWRRGAIKGQFAIDRLVSKLVSRVIAVSRAAAEFLIIQKGIPASKITVVPNGRDLTAFRSSAAARGEFRRRLGLADDVAAIGVVGRLETQKGHRFFLDALPLILAAFPGARAVLVGEGSLRDALEAQASALGVDNAVTFAGFQGDIPGIMSAMDVIVLPSLFEGMPLVAIEALAAGKPLVATRVDGTPEVVDHGVTGLLVPPAAPQPLAEAILTVLTDPALGARLGSAGRRVAHDRFDVRQQVLETERVYSAVLGSRPARPPVRQWLVRSN